jgi:hypothetical protein
MDFPELRATTAVDDWYGFLELSCGPCSTCLWYLGRFGLTLESNINQ